MDTLKKENGFTLIETLTAISILGMITVLTVILITGIFNNPKLLLKGEALFLADKEMKYTINNRIVSDSTYSSNISGLEVQRTVINQDSLYRINVSIVFKPKNREILSLFVFQAR